MLTIELTTQQRDAFVSLVDLYLRSSGVSGLETSVDLMNILRSAKPKLEEPTTHPSV